MKWLLLLSLCLGYTQTTYSHLFQDLDLGIYLSIPVNLTESWHISNKALGINAISYQTPIEEPGDPFYFLLIASIEIKTPPLNDFDFENKALFLSQSLSSLCIGKKTSREPYITQAFSHAFFKTKSESFSYYLEERPSFRQFYLNRNGCILRGQELVPLSGFLKNQVIQKRIRMYSTVEGYEDLFTLYADLHFFTHRDHLWMIVSAISPYLEEERELTAFSSEILESLELY